MPTQPRNPDTNQPIHSLADFSDAARRLAGLDYAPDDPRRPFRDDDGPIQGPELPPAPLQDKVEKFIAEKVRPTAEAAQLEAAEPAAWVKVAKGEPVLQGSLLPTLNREEITVERLYLRGGKLVDRIKGGGRYINVPVSEGPGYARSLEDAKNRLLQGQGRSVNILKSKRR